MTPDYFINIATNTGIDTIDVRKEICETFADIEKNVECAHQINDSLYMADFILRYQHIEGPLVEFGCFQGGMSCKLSYLAYLLGKKCIIFDSFNGLPQSAVYKTYNPDVKFLGEFYKHQFSCSVEQVKDNLQKYGKFFICSIIEGYVEETLPKTKINPSFVFIDVDIKETAMFIIRNIWNKINCCGIFTHEACLIDYVEGITSEEFWLKEFNQKPPELAGTFQNSNHGFKNADCLNFLVKKEFDFESYKSAIYNIN
jgi:hypothetical protein